MQTASQLRGLEVQVDLRVESLGSGRLRGRADSLLEGRGVLRVRDGDASELLLQR